MDSLSTIKIYKDTVMGGSSKPPKPTQEQLAAETRAQKRLDDETEKNERRLKALARGKSGTQSLLAQGGSNSSANVAGRANAVAGRFTGNSYSGNFGNMGIRGGR